MEINPEIAKIYQDFFPDDIVIVGDAHQYLLEHYKDFEFIWSSPRCPTHSKLRYLNEKKIYPDMRLYQEIIFLKTWHNGKFCIENVKPYYKPLLSPMAEIGRHYVWTNYYLRNINNKPGNPIKNFVIGDYERKYNINLSNYKIGSYQKRQILRNMVNPELANYILQAAREDFQPVTLSMFANISNKHNL